MATLSEFDPMQVLVTGYMAEVYRGQQTVIKIHRVREAKNLT